MLFIRICTSIFFLNGCFAVIDFDDEAQVMQVREQVREHYSLAQLDDGLEKLRQWSKQRNGDKLRISTVAKYCGGSRPGGIGAQDADVPLLQILFTHNLDVTELELICNKGLTRLDVSVLVNLTKLNLNSNALKDLTLGNLPLLRECLASDNELTDVDISGLSALERLDLSKNKLKRVLLHRSPTLQRINFYFNSIEELDIRVLSSLISVELSDSHLKRLCVDDTTNTDLQYMFFRLRDDAEICGQDMLTTFNSYARRRFIEILRGVGNDRFVQLIH